MKVKRIYKENVNVEDLSQDRVKLDLSYQEWSKIRDLVTMVEWYLPTNKDSSDWIKKLAKNIRIMFQNAQEQEPEWY